MEIVVPKEMSSSLVNEDGYEFNLEFFGHDCICRKHNGEFYGEDNCPYLHVLQSLQRHWASWLVVGLPSDVLEALKTFKEGLDFSNSYWEEFWLDEFCERYDAFFSCNLRKHLRNIINDDVTMPFMESTDRLDKHMHAKLDYLVSVVVERLYKLNDPVTNHFKSEVNGFISDCIPPTVGSLSDDDEEANDFFVSPTSHRAKLLRQVEICYSTELEECSTLESALTIAEKCGFKWFASFLDNDDRLISKPFYRNLVMWVNQYASQEPPAGGDE
jgi:hypothetical protein